MLDGKRKWKGRDNKMNLRKKVKAQQWAGTWDIVKSLVFKRGGNWNRTERTWAANFRDCGRRERRHSGLGGVLAK